VKGIPARDLARGLGVCGHIAEVLVDENTMVEYGQPLFMVKPDA